MILPFFFFFNDTATTEIYTLSLHDALPISGRRATARCSPAPGSSRPTSIRRRSARTSRPRWASSATPRSEEHTSELQSRRDLVCRLLLEKKKKKDNKTRRHKALRKHDHTHT